MFSDKEFHAWAKSGKAVMFAAVMTKIDGRKDDDLLGKYGFRGFPSLAVLDADGGALIKGLDRSMSAITNTVEIAPTYAAMKAKVDAGEKVDEAKWYMMRMRVGQMELDEAKEGLKKNELSPEDCAFAESQILGMEFLDKLRASRGQPGEEINAFVYAAFQKGTKLPKGSQFQSYFDRFLLQVATEKEDVKAFFAALPGAKKAIQDDAKSAAERIPQMEADLEKYKDNERLVPRIEAAIERAKQMVEDSKKELAELEATAKKMKAKMKK